MWPHGLPRLSIWRNRWTTVQSVYGPHGHSCWASCQRFCPTVQHTQSSLDRTVMYWEQTDRGSAWPSASHGHCFACTVSKANELKNSQNDRTVTRAPAQSVYKRELLKVLPDRVTHTVINLPARSARLKCAKHDKRPHGHMGARTVNQGKIWIYDRSNHHACAVRQVTAQSDDWPHGHA